MAKEALKRYILLSLIENEAMANNAKIMNDISQNSIKAAETMRTIDDMFWNKKKENPNPMETYPNNYNPPVNNYPPQQPQVQQYPPQINYPAFDANREAAERQQRIASYQQLVQNLYSQINSLQTQLFDGVQKIHQQIGEISKSLYQ